MERASVPLVCVFAWAPPIAYLTLSFLQHCRHRGPCRLSSLGVKRNGGLGWPQLAHLTSSD